MENQRQKRKRAKKHTYIAKRRVLSGAEGASYTQAAQKVPIEVAVEAALEQQQQASRKCSICTSTEHTAHTCPRRQAISQ
jgi:hypothetical protein